MDIILESPFDVVLQEDLEYIANSNIPLPSLQNNTILITGSNGLIGSQVVKALICCNRLKNTNIRILAVARNPKKSQKVFGPLLNVPNLSMIYRNVDEPIEINEDIDYIIHGASKTASKDYVTYPVETINTALEGTKNLLELAYNKKVKGFVYLSSMEVLGITDPSLKWVKEENYGYIDILNVRSSYSESKRMAECMCASYAHEYKLPIKIARLAQIFGAGVSFLENRVFAQFAKSVINKTDIVLHTTGESTGNYCYTRDAVIAILTLLIKGQMGEAYIIVNELSNCKIKDMAYMVAEKLANNEISVLFDIPENTLVFGYAPKVKMKLNAGKMQVLGWKAEIGLEESYKRMIKSMQNMQRCE